jgi:hypothetical protein
VTTQPLLPGASEVVSLALPGDTQLHDYYIVIDANQNGGGVVNECIESNNTSALTNLTCQLFL